MYVSKKMIISERRKEESKCNQLTMKRKHENNL